MNTLFRTQLTVASVICIGLTSTVSAQVLPGNATWDRTSIEEGFLNDFSLTRTVLGPRAIGMGRAGLALSAGIEYHSLNPASILGLSSIQMFSEGSFRSGSATTDAFPEYLDKLQTNFSDFRVKPGSDFGYGGLNLGMPLTLLGARGALGVAYSRQRFSPVASENREEALGALTQNTPSSMGIRNRPDGGYDAITFSAARRLFDKLDVGANLNYESGWIQQKYSVDVSVFGRPAAAEKRSFNQEFSSLSFDMGARADFGRFSGGISLFAGHDIEYDKGKVKRTPLYIIGDQAPQTFKNDILDHTLHVPSRLGIGGAYEPGDRLTLAVDYWTQDWSTAAFTRQRAEPFYTFTDPSDSASFFYFLTPVDGETETVNAKMSDTNSFRIGMEYYILANETLRIPIRIGWQTEGLTRGEVDVNVEDGDYADYLQTVEDYRRDLENGVQNPDSEVRLREFLTRGAFVHRTAKETQSHTISLGTGLEIEELTVDLSLDIQTADAGRYFNTLFSPQWWPFVDETRGSRTISTISLGARIVF